MKPIMAPGRAAGAAALAGAWRAGVILACALAVLLLGQQPVWSQQQGERWTSQDSTFSVSIPPGWSRIDRYVQGPYLLAIGPSPEIARRERRGLGVCSIEGRPIETRPLRQEQINEMVEAMREPLLRELRPLTVHTSQSDILAGVRVISIDIDQQSLRGGVTRQMQRMFAVPIGAGMMHYQIGCGASGSAYVPADIAVMHQFIASLTLAPGAPP